MSKKIKITEDQAKRLFKKKNKIKITTEQLKLVVESETKPNIDFDRFSDEIVVFLKDILANPKKVPLSTYWDDLGISRHKLFQIVKNADLITDNMNEGEGMRRYSVKKEGFRSKIQKAHKVINEMSDGYFPGDAYYDPQAPYNEDNMDDDPIIPEKEYASIQDYIPGNEKSYTLFLTPKGREVVWDSNTVDDKSFEPYQDIKGHIDEEAIDRYFNDNLFKEIKLSANTNDLNQGFAVLVTDKNNSAVDDYFELDNLTETTTATSSGQYSAPLEVRPIDNDEYAPSQEVKDMLEGTIIVDTDEDE